MKRVLVTGATGFIGTAALPLLAAAGFEVHALGRTPPAAGLGVAHHALDLLDADAVWAAVARIRPTHCLHLAWNAEPGRFWAAPNNLDWAGATFALARAFAASGGERFVGAGTCAEYEWAGDAPLAEATTPSRPATLYGAAKDGTRRILEGFAASAGFSFAWGRVFFLYGPGEKRGRLVSDVAASLLAGETVAATTGEQRRDFLHVRDVAGAFAALLDGTVAGPVNIGAGLAVPVRDVLSTIGGLAGGADRIRFGARPMAPNDPPVIVADTTRLICEVGFWPAVPLADGLAETVAWWRETVR